MTDYLSTIKQIFIIELNEEPGSTYHKLGCQHEYNYSVIVVKGDITGKLHYNWDEPINLKTHIYSLTSHTIAKTGGLFNVVYLKEKDCSYIVYKSMLKDIDLHSKELRDEFFDSAKECMLKIKEYNPDFDIKELRHYFAVIPEGCMCRHCYRVIDKW